MKIFKKKTIIHYFNIVEVALALAIVGIGIAGIMSLFPVALNASRDSVADNYSPDVADQFLAYLETECRKDWSITSNDQYIPTTATAVPEQNIPDADWTETFTGSGVFKHNNGKKGVFKVVQQTGTIVDFAAIVKVWRTKNPDGDINGDNTGDGKDCSIENLYFKGKTIDIPIEYAVGLNVEISWPIEKPEDQREKRLYYLEIFNFN